VFQGFEIAKLVIGFMQDREHLQILVYFHYAWSALAVVLTCFQLVFLIVFAKFGFLKARPPAVFELFYAIAGGVALSIGLAMAVCTFLAARFLAARKCYVFCLMVAAMNSTIAPLGTGLGIFTFIVLLRPTVKELFGRGVAQSTL
jgi:hypothetical protein